MSCKCAKFDSEVGRYSCSVSDDGCVFMIPNSKLCAEMYGEGPDAETDKCEDCKKFYVENNKRCCSREPEQFKDGEFIKSKFLNNITCCGEFISI